MTPDLGLALSGGGSRAAAFHRGTLRALGDLKLTPHVRSISAVSGGAVFAASWMAARARDQSDGAFLDWFADVLVRGFVWPALWNLRALKMLWPGWSRTNRLAETFDEVLFRGMQLSQLPKDPILCLNTTLLNNASSGRFSRSGYSGAGVSQRDSDGYRDVYIAGVSLGFATAASAAFPFALPPLVVRCDRIRPAPGAELARHKKLLFTDGGVIENLGIERLQHSPRFGAPHILVSDAGQHLPSWQPSWRGRLQSALAYTLSADTLDRLLTIMSDKQNRSMRELAYIAFHLEAAPPSGGKLWFVRLEHDWDQVVTGNAASSVLAPAREIYDQMGGMQTVQEIRAVTTGFFGLERSIVDKLEAHARWQVHAAIAQFGAPPG